MKKKFFLAIAVFLAAGAVCAEETGYQPTYLEDWAKQATVAEAFFMYPGSSAGIRYETKIDDTLSAGVSINYNFAGLAPSYGARVDCNLYPQAHALNAWFYGPFAGVYNLNTEYSGPVFFSLGARGGYRWIFDYITVTPGIMVQYGLGYEAGKKIWAGAAGFNYAAGISVGYAFGEKSVFEMITKP